MKPFEIPKCKQQKDFEDLAINLIKVMAQMTVEKQMELFEFAQDLAFNKPDVKKMEVNTMKIYELSPMGYERAKSFYGKAKVIEKDNGETVLQSYDTEVCKITSGGEFVRLWSGYSVTTMRHVNSFLQLVGIAGGGKAWWDAQKIGA